MRLHREALGANRIIGSEFPQERERAEPSTPRDKTLRYIADRLHPPRDMDRVKDMNPNGFWECPFTVRGIAWGLGAAEIYEQLYAGDRPNVVKVVSQGLSNTNPADVGKVVYMLRNPVSVAKSQERLGRPAEAPDGGVVHTPEMFIRVNRQAARWALKNPHIPVHVVEYDSLIDRPEDTIAGVVNFHGQDGDWRRAASVIDRDLRRSKPEPQPSDLWADAWHVYHCWKDGRLEDIEPYFKEKRTATQAEGEAWHCFRWKAQVTAHNCKLCKSNPTVAANYRKWATKKGIDWQAEPCVWECGLDTEQAVPLTIEQSIQQNHWKQLDAGQQPVKRSKIKLSAKQILTGAFGVVQAAMPWAKLADDATFENRKKECVGCIEYHFGVCTAEDGCGCNLATKVRLQKSKCPLGKW